MQELNNLVKRLVSVRAKRLDLEKQADELKNGEEKDLTTQILALMSSGGMKSCHIPGVARLASKTTYHYEITDIDALVMLSFKQMIQAGKEGRPISEGLMFQRRPSKENIEAYMHDILRITPDDDGYDASCAGVGVAHVGKETLSVTKA
jgi:hypothetical protein